MDRPAPVTTVLPVMIEPNQVVNKFVFVARIALSIVRAIDHMGAHSNLTRSLESKSFETVA